MKASTTEAAQVWTASSQPAKPLLAAIACIGGGALFLWLTRDTGRALLAGTASFGTNAAAAVVLGALLLVVGIAAALTWTRQTVAIDPRMRRIVVNDTGPLRRATRQIAFADVQSVGIGLLGRKSTGVYWYYLVLHLRGGGEYALFAPGRFYEGGGDRRVVEGWQRRLETMLERGAAHGH